MPEWLSVRLPTSGTVRIAIGVFGATVVVLTAAGAYFRRRRRKHKGPLESVDDSPLPNTVVLTPYTRTLDTPSRGAQRHSSQTKWPPAGEIGSVDELCHAGLQALQLALHYWQTASLRLGQQRLNGSPHPQVSTSRESRMPRNYAGNSFLSSDGTVSEIMINTLPPQDSAILLEHIQQMVENARLIEEDFQRRFLLDTVTALNSPPSTVSNSLLTNENLANVGDGGRQRYLSVEDDLAMSGRRQVDFVDGDGNLSDSSAESFVSATMEFANDEEIKELNMISADIDDVSSRGDISFYKSAMQLVKKGLIPCRTFRTEMLNCITDSDFLAKLHCVRQAFEHMFRDISTRDWLVEAGKQLMSAFLVVAGKDPKDFVEEYSVMSEFVAETPKEMIMEELKERKVVFFGFFDIVLDFALMDAFVDLENPPSAITSILNNRWLTWGFKETALSTAVWSVLKAKVNMLRSQHGFLGHFYGVMSTLSPTLAWGFLGPDEDLRAECYHFKDEVLSLIRDMFSFKSVRYCSVEALSEDILKLIELRHDQLLHHFGIVKPL